MIKNKISNLKKYIKAYVTRPFIKFRYDNSNVIKLKELPLIYATSHGEQNVDKMFYIIWRNHGGAGFFSNFHHVLTHLKIAENLNMIPIIDFKNFKTFYNEEHLVNNTDNAWEYYFTQPTQYTLNDAMNSKNVFMSSGEFPETLWNTEVRQANEFKRLYQKYIFLNRQVQQFVNVTAELVPARCLGVHFRGKEMNYAPSHPFGATVKQMFKYTNIMLKKYKLSKILLISEDQHYIDLFKAEYSDKLIITDSFCVAKINAYNIYPRKDHKYLLGLEVFRDATLLSKCTALLCTDSNVSQFATKIGNHEVIYKIDNGINSNKLIFSRYLFTLKKYLPSALGGLKNRIIKIYNSQ
jgi:hypothetical protein